MTINMRNTNRKGHHSSIIEEALNSITPEKKTVIETRMALAAYIYDCMIAAGHTRTTFAEKMDQNPSVITKWLSGTHNFTLDTLVLIGRALGVSLIATGPASFTKEQGEAIHVYVAKAKSNPLAEIEIAANALFNNRQMPQIMLKATEGDVQRRIISKESYAL